MPVRGGGLPAGWRVAPDARTRVRRQGLVTGGTPWGLVKLGSAAADLLTRLVTAGADGVVLDTPLDRAAADRLIERGLAHPVAPPGTCPPLPPATVVVPAYGRPDLLARCLASLPGLDVVVVDDASPTSEIARVARAHGARLLQHRDNRGPAAARNTGLAATDSPLVAFLDADCVTRPGWLPALARLFDDPRVGAVAPRVLPRAASTGLIPRHEQARSALDMGPRRALVRHGGALGFLPSACLMIRRAALAGQGFDEDLRLGEDVDLIWRLVEGGWHVRYEPSVVVEHEMRSTPLAWARRRYEYGTSAAALDERHPGRLAPARVSAWNLATLAAVAAGRSWTASATTAAATAALAHRLRSSEVEPSLAALIVGKGLLADAAAIGHLLRREWWPVGALALATSARSRTARLATACMLAPVALEWLRERPQVDPARYGLLRLVEDAAYGSGVITSAMARRRPGPLLPQVRLSGSRRSSSLMKISLQRPEQESTRRPGWRRSWSHGQGPAPLERGHRGRADPRPPWPGLRSCRA